MSPDRRAGDLAVRFWGARGSLPVPGRDTVIYGGNTCCVEVRLGSRLFMVDAGTGFEGAGRARNAEIPHRIDLLLSHLHQDHVSGLPFFSPILGGACSIRIHCGNLGGETAQGPLEMLFSPPLFPVKLTELPAQLCYVGFRAGDTLEFEDGIRVKTCPLRHPGGATGYRFDHAGRSVCYVSDIEHDPGGPVPELVRFCQGADLVIYDAMFTEPEFEVHRGWGHSTWQAGVSLCKAAGARALAAFHHHKRHDDAALAAIEAQLAIALPGSFVAREGQTVAFHPSLVRSDAAE